MKELKPYHGFGVYAEECPIEEVLGKAVDIALQIAQRRKETKRRTYESFLPGCMKGLWAKDVSFMRPLAMRITALLKRESPPDLDHLRTFWKRNLLSTLSREQKTYLEFLHATNGLHIQEERNEEK